MGLTRKARGLRRRRAIPSSTGWQWPCRYVPGENAGNPVVTGEIQTQSWRRLYEHHPALPRAASHRDSADLVVEGRGRPAAGRDSLGQLRARGRCVDLFDQDEKARPPISPQGSTKSGLPLARSPGFGRAGRGETSTRRRWHLHDSRPFWFPRAFTFANGGHRYAGSADQTRAEATAEGD